MTERNTSDTAEPRYTHCPICGGVLQATVSLYVTNCEVDADGDLLDYDEEEDGFAIGAFRVYCENDCTWDEISEELTRQQETEDST